MNSERKGLSPLEMEIMCFARYSPGPYHVLVPSQAISLGKLFRRGLVACGSLNDPGGNPDLVFQGQMGRHIIRLTEMGDAWLDRALATPMPVQKTIWVFPEE